MKSEAIRETATAAPPISIAGLSLWGFPLSEWVLLLTAIYTLFLIIDKLPSVATQVAKMWVWAKENINGQVSSQ